MPFSRSLKPLLIACLTLQSALGSSDFWEMQPIRYSDTPGENILTKLASDLASGTRRMEGSTELERLKFVLHELRVPEASQILVFSKTSHQNSLIRPSNPRALYFSENAYVGFVPGGAIEVIVQDPQLGPVYYLIESATTGGLSIERDQSSCISCHATNNTENVPGMLVRSVCPDEDGHPILALGTSLVDHETPLPDRWGGYYVTGRSSLPHLGNQRFVEKSTPVPLPSEQPDLTSVIDVKKYLRPTSDIVALLVLEHQCRMHNLFTAASMNYRRARFLNQVLKPDAKPEEGSASKLAESMAAQIVECLFFKNEASCGEDVEGSSEFQKAFESRYPRTQDGHSLADFKLYERIFKYRCSTMIYSEAFAQLPAPVKAAVLKKMHVVLAGEDPEFAWLKASERQKIQAILAETLPGWNG
jgi:hypothetical protein